MNSKFVAVTCPSCKETLRINVEYPGSGHNCEYCQKHHAVIRENGRILALAPGLSSVEYHRVEMRENMECLLEHIERYVPLEKWKFQQSANFFANGGPQSMDYKVVKAGYPVVIYNSPKCRVFFMLDYSGSGRSYAAFVYYGRLHAPSNKRIMTWNKEDCHCWHRIDDFTLSFLEGLSPSEASKRRLNMRQELADDSDFLNSGTAEVQYPLKLHAAIWNKYGDKLFNLFDLGNTELWSKYRKYLKEYYDIRGWNATHFTPELYKVC